MARVIKAGDAAPQRPLRPATRVLAGGDVRKVIEKELIAARQQVQQLLDDTEVERKDIVADGKAAAAQAHEEAMVRGAQEAFARAAEEALRTFRERALRYGDAAEDIRALALALFQKITGSEPDLSRAAVDRTVQQGIAALRAKRRLRLQVSVGRRAALAYERPNLLKAVDAQPDLVVEEVADVREGFARVVTEVGGALCAEDAALQALAEAVGVQEQRRERRERPPAAQVVPTRPRLPQDMVSDVITSPGTLPPTPPAARPAALPQAMANPLRNRTSMSIPVVAPLDSLPDAAVVSMDSEEGEGGEDDEDPGATEVYRPAASRLPVNAHDLFTDDAIDRAPQRRR
jgi:hypothetical protein